MSEIKLLPCPFCGGEVAMEEVPYTNNIEIKCKMCQVSMIKKAFRPNGTTEIDVVKTWNTRKPIEDMVEQLDKACFSPEGDYPGFVIDAEQAVDIVRGGRE